MKSLKRLLCIGMAASGALLCAQIPSGPTLAGPSRPAGVPVGYVITPNGYFHPSCVRQLTKGDVVLSDRGAIQHMDGTIENISACNYPRYTIRGEAITGGATESPTISHSWVEDEQVATSTSYGGVIQTWTVPPNPRSNDGQTLAFFPGLQGTGGSWLTILQPVLAWNGFSSFKGWSIASWNCCYDNVNLYSSPIGVSAGDFILGEVMSNCSAGTLSCPTWYVTIEDPNKGSTTLPSTSSYGQTFDWATGGALEVYSVVQCSDYPSNGSLTFSGALYDENFEPINSPSWSLDVTYGLTPQCNYGGQAQGGTVTLDY